MGMTTSYRVHGITDETDTCEVCGKVELKRVIMLGVLDADGNQEDIIYAGSTCAARKLSNAGAAVKATRVRDAASAAGRVWTQARAFVTEMDGVTFNVYLKANWVAAQNHGVQRIRDGFDEMLIEIAAIKAGTLAGTRWEKNLPVI